MMEIEKPKMNIEESPDGSTCRLVVEPLERGFGITLGNALRRVLLAALPGAAVVGVKIDGVQHAKIKNMYMRDIRGFADLDVKLTPYVACTSDISGRGAAPAIGMSLNISF